jgi:hypothetical protein
MINNLKLAKKEVLSFLLIIIVIAFLISSLANIAYNEFYLANPVGFILWVTFLLIFSGFISFILLTASLASTTTKIKMNFTFDREHQCFVDIPHCPSSVNARVMFDNLDSAHQQHIASCTKLQNFGDSVLSQFLDNVVQMLILSNVLKSASRVLDKNCITNVPLKDMPENIRANKYLKKHLNNEAFIALLKNYKITPLNQRKSFFKLNGAYGSISFEWHLAMIQTAYNSGAYLESLVDVNREHCCDFYMTVLMTNKISYLRLLSKKTNIFANWTSSISDELESYDWKRAQENLPMLMIGKVLSEIKKNA